MDFSNLVNYLLVPELDEYALPLPEHTAYITLTVHGPSVQDPHPGDRDPSVPSAISRLFKNKSRKFPKGSNEWWHYGLQSSLYAGDAGPYNGKPWWDRATQLSQAALLASDEMTYVCDSALGSPSTVDCSQVESSQLGSPSDTLQVGPSVTFLHQNSCYIAITASVALVLTWEQVRVALNALLGSCVDNPYDRPQGGRAFYSPPPALGKSGKTKRGDPTTLNALPPHANITVSSFYVSG